MGMANMVTTTNAPGGGFPNKIIKEDVSNIIYNLSPTDTPMLSMAKRGSAHDTQVVWSLDRLVDPSLEVGVGEGADAVTTNPNLVQKKTNGTQIFQKTASVSGTVESVDWYGRGSEMAYQMTKRSEELKRDIESTICGSPMMSAAQIDYAATWITDTRRFAPYKAQIGAANVPTGFNDTVTDLGQTRISEAAINTAMQNMWDFGGAPDKAVVTGTMSTRISALAIDGGGGLAGRFRDATQGTKLVNVVDVYVTPFGELDIIPSRFLNVGESVGGAANGSTGGEHDIFLVDSEYIEVCYLRTPETQQLANTGDNENRMIVTELTFKVLSPEAVGLIADIDESVAP